MIKRMMGILDQDDTYLHRLLSFARTSEIGGQFILKSFSSWSSVINSQDALDVLLADPQLLPDSESEWSQSFKIVYLLDQDQSGNGELEEMFLYRYQPLNQLFDRLSALVLAPNHIQPLVKSNQVRSKLISVFSAVGGCGKTTLALNLARMLSFQGRKVFYLNMESFSSVQLFAGHPDERPFEKLLYYVKSGATPLHAKLAWLKKIDPISKLEYIEPCRNALDMEEMSVEDTLSLLKAIDELHFDYIIIDCASSFHQRICTSLTASHVILWIIQDDFQVLDKTAAAVAEFHQNEAGKVQEAAPQIHYVLNKFTGHLVNDLQAKGFSPSCRLPYIPNWKSVSSVQSLLAESSYTDELTKWFMPLFERDGGKAFA